MNAALKDTLKKAQNLPVSEYRKHACSQFETGDITAPAELREIFPPPKRTH
jgi:hypothetical protein